MTQQWYLKNLSQSRLVTLPHTWNIEEENQNHYGWGWYEKTIAVPADWASSRINSEFNAVFFEE